MSKTLRKAIMRRSALKNRYYRDRLPESERAFKKQRNYTTKLLKKEKKRYYYSLNVNNYTDNKKFWNTVKPLFSNYNGGSKTITIVDDDNVISNDEDIANTLNKFFENSTKTLGIRENNILLNRTDHLSNPVDIALKKFENHPSIVNIKEKVAVDTKFSFKKVEILDTKTEIRNLDIKKGRHLF